MALCSKFKESVEVCPTCPTEPNYGKCMRGLFPLPKFFIDVVSAVMGII